MRRCTVVAVVSVFVLFSGAALAEDRASVVPSKVQKFLDGLTGTWNVDGTFRGQVEYQWDSKKKAVIGTGQWTQVESGMFNSWTDMLCWDGTSEDGVTNFWLSATDHTMARGEVQGKVLSKTVMVGKETVVGSPVASSTTLKIEHKGPNRFVMTVKNVVHEGEKRPDMRMVFARAGSERPEPQTVKAKRKAKAMKPAAVKKMLKRLAGNWTWTGEQADIDAESSPYGQAGRFVGSGEGRLIMDGQFVLDKYQEKSPEGNVLYGVSLLNYDPIKKCFVARDCLSDGSISVSEFTVEGRVRTDHITITSKTGEILLARVTGEYSRDWKRYEAVWEGSTDNGKTWREWATLVNEKTGETGSDVDIQGM